MSRRMLWNSINKGTQEKFDLREELKKKRKAIRAKNKKIKELKERVLYLESFLKGRNYTV